MPPFLINLYRIKSDTYTISCNIILYLGKKASFVYIPNPQKNTSQYKKKIQEKFSNTAIILSNFSRTSSLTSNENQVYWSSYSMPDIFLYNFLAYPSVIPLIKSVAIKILWYKSSSLSVNPSVFMAQL